MNTFAADMHSEGRVYIVDDDESMRRAVRMLLRANGYYVESFETANDFFAYKKEDVPSCVILDVRLKGHSGLAVQEQFAAMNVTMPIIFMTGYGDIAMSVKAMKAGALDFLSKPFGDQDMLDAVRSALLRDAERREIARCESTLRKCYAALSPREREVMEYVAQGLLNKQIASQLDLTEITIKIHRAQAMRKMGARSFAEFVLQARALGIVPDPGKPATQV